jgi:putative mycofactocin binding protein MftB
MTVDLGHAWRLDTRVSARPESFGALLYSFETRRLSFLKTRTMFDVVRSLADHPSGRDACLAAGVPASEMPIYEQALAGSPIRP